MSAQFLPVTVSLSCTAPYLTSPFLLLSPWVSVSAGHPAIAVARKGGVLGAADFQMDPKIVRATAPFFNVFRKIPKIIKKQEMYLFFNTFQGF